jgi:hypothetical protein
MIFIEMLKEVKMIKSIDRFSQKGKLLVLFIMIVMILTCWLPASASKCKDAATRCFVAAGLSSVGNLKLGADLVIWCIYGYIWCKQFYVE